MKQRTGRFAIIEQFLKDGMDHMFGNPGTVEQGFLDALKDFPQMKYILTLQESIAVLMADGYARATQKPTLVQLHSSPGIGNAVGALYQAKRGHSPLVVIGGDAGVKYMNMDAQMANDLVAMMAPVTKYATVVLDSRSLLRTLRRAIKIAMTPPMGPVYICLPMDILDEINNEEVLPSCQPLTRVLPVNELLEEAATMILAGSRPVIYVGDGVAYSKASSEVTLLAELLGAEVYGVDCGDFLMDTSHPLYRGTTGHMFGASSLPITRKGDLNLIIGTYMMPEVFPHLEEIYAPQSKVIHLDLNSYEIGKNHRVDLGIVCDPRSSIKALTQIIKQKMTVDYKKEAKLRVDYFSKLKKDETEAAKRSDEQWKERTPLHMSVFAKAVAPYLPEDVIIFDEALTNSPAFTRYVAPKEVGTSFTTRGGSLGVGIPGAMGVKMAHPEKTVIGLTGDGGSMYTIQALWTAARHKIGAKFIICNNGSYRLLQLNIDAYWKERNETIHPHPLCFDLSEPAIDFAKLASSLGVRAVKVEHRDQMKSAIEQMLSNDEPFLIDLILEGDRHPEDVSIKCGQ